MLRKLLKIPAIHRFIRFSKTISAPGFDNYSLFEVLRFFIQRLMEGDVQSRARSIAFSFFLALFPAIIFLFSLIPYVPVDGFQDRLMLTLKEIMPPYTYEASRITIEDIIKRERGGLLSLGILFTLYVSSNGVLSLIHQFNYKSHYKQPSGWNLRIKAILLTIFLAVLVIMTIALLILSEVTVHYLSDKIRLTSQVPIYALLAGKWLLLIGLCFTAISSLYYFGSNKHVQWRFVSAGSTLATILVIGTSLGFNYFITHFAQYNKLYGSLGTLIIILIWMNFNCLQLIVGYELNASIEQAKMKGKKTLLQSKTHEQA